MTRKQLRSLCWVAAGYGFCLGAAMFWFAKGNAVMGWIGVVIAVIGFFVMWSDINEITHSARLRDTARRAA